MDARFPTSPFRIARVLCALSLICAGNPAIAEEAKTDGIPAKPATVAENPRTAEDHLARGLELYGQNHYTEAIAEFRAGYALHADGQLLYALAQALRLAGQCGEAISHYQRFLDSAPSPTQSAAARVNLERCREQILSSGTTPPSPKPEEARRPELVEEHHTQPSTDTAPPTQRASRPAPNRVNTTPAWYADPLGATLTGAGLLGVGAGTALMVLGNAKRVDSEKLSDGTTPGTYQKHEDRTETGRVEFLSGAISTGVGLAAIVLGTLRYYSVASRPSVELALTVLSSEARATLGGAF